MVNLNKKIPLHPHVKFDISVKVTKRISVPIKVPGQEHFPKQQQTLRKKGMIETECLISHIQS